MTNVSRRLWVYWLLLLLPTVAVGVGAIQLLRREQARIAAQEASAGEARRAAAASRAALILENVELLVGDFQTGLLEALAAMPAGAIEREMLAWENGNPLVRAAFRCTTGGRIIHPPASATDEEARGFRRRFAPLLEGSPPWRVGAPPPAALAEAKEAEQPEEASREERFARQQAASNVAQLQSARRDARALTKVKDYSAEGAMAAPAPAAAEPLGASEMSDALVSSFRTSSLDEADAGRRREVNEAKNIAAKVAAPTAAEMVAVPVVSAGRQGWVPWPVDGRLHLLGWVEMPALDEVRGVEVELAALVARLGATLPLETGPGEGFALRDDRGRVMHQAGWSPRNGTEPVVRLPLAGGALPGWEVVAFLDTPARADGEGAGIFLLGSLLTGILLVTILAGGTLLAGQARRSEAEAAQKTSFVANVSHEFKTPLTTIRLYAELLEQGRVADAAKQRDYLQTIGRETQRLARLVGNALDFSRLEQGRKKFAREPLDLRAELGRLLDTHGPRLAEAGLELRRELPEAPVPATTDRDALEQIVLNLLDNAAKYAAAGGEVTVALAPRAGGGAVIRVLDRGPGVPAAHRERIFEKFHRVDDTLTAEKTGTGLGLSIARQLARGLGGDLRFAPRDGGGAAFNLELPR